ncbi:glycosyltransferase [Christensenellaceae bacterium OttesenSCG-928-L17]|nr:glycosyltransferase [Christensenellaceae bacterium OttesenSCG-928-L17]
MQKSQLTVKPKHICVLLSSYNGAHHLARQIDSILSQTGNYKITIYLRDDGSKDKTVSIAKKYPQVQLDHTSGPNLGWRASFHQLLMSAPKADIYAFSDQDDIWFENKLQDAIDAIGSTDSPVLWQSQPEIVNPDLKPINYRETFELPKNYKRALAELHALGSGMVFNRPLLELYREGVSRGGSQEWQKYTSHDTYMFILAYFFGKVIFSAQPYYYWIRYNNSTTASSRSEAWLGRLKNLLNKPYTYARHDRELLSMYNDQLSAEQRKFLTLIGNYKKGANRFKILFDRQFNRETIPGKIFFKLSILLGRY